jgi:hypothetical protein
MRYLLKIPKNYDFKLHVNNYKGKKFQKYYISKLLEPPFTPKEDIHNKAQEFITNIIPTITNTIIPNINTIFIIKLLITN